MFLFLPEYDAPISALRLSICRLGRKQQNLNIAEWLLLDEISCVVDMEDEDGKLEDSNSILTALNNLQGYTEEEDKVGPPYLT